MCDRLQQIKEKSALQKVAITNLHGALQCLVSEQHQDALGKFSAAEVAENDASAMEIEGLNELYHKLSQELGGYNVLVRFVA